MSLKSKREMCGISQRELERRSGITQAAISNIEKGKANPTISTMKSLSAALHCTIEELLADEPKERSDSHD